MRRWGYGVGPLEWTQANKTVTAEISSLFPPRPRNPIALISVTSTAVAVSLISTTVINIATGTSTVVARILQDD